MNQISLFDDFNKAENVKLIDINEACELLSISEATGRNWIKSGLMPVESNGKKPMFSRSVIEDLAIRIKTGEVKRLKSRRNKTQTSGMVIPKNYIENNKIYDSVCSIIEAFSKIEFSKRKQNLVLAEYALQLLHSRNLIEFNIFSGSYIFEYCRSKSAAGEFGLIIDFLLDYSAIQKDEVDELEQVLSTRLIYSEDDILGLLYMALQCVGNRKQKGIYYTPYKLVHDCIGYLNDNNLLSDGHDIVDPCCGTGNFLLECARFGCPIENLHGFDSDILSVFLCRINLALATMTKNVELLEKNIVHTDSLLLETSNAYDICVGNPPWGYEFSTEETKKLSKMFETAKGKTIESFSVFIEQSLKMIKQGGVISFILPESITNVKLHECVRKHIVNNSNLLRVRYWGDIFDGINCPAINLTLRKVSVPTQTEIDVQDNLRTFTIENIRQIGSNNWNLNVDDFEYGILSAMQSIDIKYLKGNADFALGIVTGNNEKYIHHEKKDNAEPVLRGSDIYKYVYGNSKQFIIFEPEKFQQVAPVELYRAKEKLLYRFICDSLVFAYDNNKTLTLNSGNIMIPHLFGMEIKYVLAVLNSRAAQFYFKLKNNSVKVLRSHIENLPIPSVSLSDQKIIIGLVDQIIQAKDSSMAAKIYDEIDERIMKAYKLSTDYVSYIKQKTQSNNLFLRP